MKIKILIPVFNDWQSLSKLLNNIDSEIQNINHEISVVVVDDASTFDRQLEIENLLNINSVKILIMRENRGHARCIAAGLKYIFEKEEFDYVIPMDGDGEDRPEEIKEFIKSIENNPKQTVVGERVKRSETYIFKFCYFFHKIITLVFTGHSIKFGNFTCLTKSTVEKLVNEKATWNSFSGALTKVDKNKTSIRSIRGERYFGPSKMSFSNLLKHSLSIISVFRKTVLIRSALFIIFYFYLIKSNVSTIMLTPFILLLIMIYSISSLAMRENIEEYKNSLKNITNIESLK
ncbi:glycosyltransferase [Candidatus Pelagibacter sp.]|nr:glycosyltransferase [Candidatus Pelagibacter sp.]